MNEQTTLESRQKTQNGVKRLVFVVLSILLEVTLIVLLFTSLNDYDRRGISNCKGCASVS